MLGGHPGSALLAVAGARQLQPMRPMQCSRHARGWARTRLPERTLAIRPGWSERSLLPAGRWEEEFMMLVHDPDQQEFTAIIYDSDLIGADKEARACPEAAACLLGSCCRACLRAPLRPSSCCQGGESV